MRASSGDVTLEGAPIGAWDVSASSGDVHMRLPATPRFDLDLHTGSGGIETALPVTISGTQSRHELRGQVRGGGPRVHVSTRVGQHQPALTRSLPGVFSRSSAICDIESGVQPPRSARTPRYNHAVATSSYPPMAPELEAFRATVRSALGGRGRVGRPAQRRAVRVEPGARRLVGRPVHRASQRHRARLSAGARRGHRHRDPRRRVRRPGRSPTTCSAA